MLIPILNQLIEFFHGLSPEVMLIGIYLGCMITLFFMTRLFGVVGLFMYSVIAIFISNIQVLKAAQFSLLENPVALGTVVFSTTFLATDIVTEYYSRKKALKLVWAGFIAMIFLAVIMILTIGIRPLDLPTSEHLRFVEAHRAMEVLFLPAPAIFFASLISYLVSQLNDVWLFSTLKKLTHTKYLWIRSGLSTMVSAFLDTVLFSVLVWVVFSDKPLSFEMLVWTYILGTYALRLLMSVVNIPAIYGIRRCLPKEEKIRV